MDWSVHYPAFAEQTPQDETQQTDSAQEVVSTRKRPLTQRVEIADIGCGFGGLLFALAPILPNTLIMGW